MGRRAAQADLPSLENLAILALEALAGEYAEIRDQRIALNSQEVDLKSRGPGGDAQAETDALRP